MKSDIDDITYHSFCTDCSSRCCSPIRCRSRRRRRRHRRCSRPGRRCCNRTRCCSRAHCYNPGRCCCRNPGRSHRSCASPGAWPPAQLQPPARQPPKRLAHSVQSVRVGCEKHVLRCAPKQHPQTRARGRSSLTRTFIAEICSVSVSPAKMAHTHNFEKALVSWLVRCEL